jgi:hypothetical protein
MHVLVHLLVHVNLLHIFEDDEDEDDAATGNYRY